MIPQLEGKGEGAKFLELFYPQVKFDREQYTEDDWERMKADLINGSIIISPTSVGQVKEMALFSNGLRLVNAAAENLIHTASAAKTYFQSEAVSTIQLPDNVPLPFYSEQTLDMNVEFEKGPNEQKNYENFVAAQLKYLGKVLKEGAHELRYQTSPDRDNIWQPRLAILTDPHIARMIDCIPGFKEENNIEVSVLHNAYARDKLFMVISEKPETPGADTGKGFGTLLTLEEPSKTVHHPEKNCTLMPFYYQFQPHIPCFFILEFENVAYRPERRILGQ